MILCIMLNSCAVHGMQEGIDVHQVYKEFIGFGVMCLSILGSMAWIKFVAKHSAPISSSRPIVPQAAQPRTITAVEPEKTKSRYGDEPMQIYMDRRREMWRFR